MSNALTLVMGDINAAKGDFEALLADNSIKFEQEAGFAMQILRNNDYSLGIATRNRDSVIAAVKNLAAIGISLNPAKKQAYLVPRGGAICLDISYMGLLDLAIASGSILWGQAVLVREADSFELQGFDKQPLHRRNPFAPDRGDWIGVYVVVKTRDGDYLTETMTRDEVLEIRDRSEAWKSFMAKKAKSCPWATDEGEMAKKTVIKRASKLWPKTDRLDQAIHHLNTDGGEGIKDINERPQEPGIDVEPYIAAALRTTTDADALKYWRDNNAVFVKQPADHKRLKDAIAGHRARMAESAKANTIDQEMPEVQTGAEQGEQQ